MPKIIKNQKGGIIMLVNYLNLTNGIEFINADLDITVSDFKFVRIQSTICEQKMWDRLIQDLDYNFLLDLVVGNRIIFYDTSARKKVPRAIYQGLEVVKYFVYMYCLEKEYTPIVKGHNITNYLKGIKLEDRTIKKLKYIKKFVLTDKLIIATVSFQTNLDGNYEIYKQILKDKYKGDK